MDTYEQERRRAAKKAEDAVLLRMKTEEIEQKVADSNERLAQRKARQVPLVFPFSCETDSF